MWSTEFQTAVNAEQLQKLRTKMLREIAPEDGGETQATESLH